MSPITKIAGAGCFLLAACLVSKWISSATIEESVAPASVSQQPPPPPRWSAVMARETITPGDAITKLNAFLGSERVIQADYQEDAVVLLQEWAQSSPEAALTYALSPLEDDSVCGLFLSGADEVIGIWARRDPRGARTFLESSVSNPQILRQLGPAVMREYARQRPGEALDWVASGITSDSGELRPVLALELIKVLDERGQRARLQAWLSQPSIASSAFAIDATAELARRVAHDHPHQAIRFASDLPEGSMTRGVALQETFRSWTMRDPLAAHSYLQSMLRKVGGTSEPELDYAIAGYSLALADADLANAITNAAQILDDSVRAKVMLALKQK